MFAFGSSQETLQVGKYQNMIIFANKLGFL